jgi:soluble lytic murein transglycosylase-like protein
MKRIILLIFLLFPSFAHAENICPTWVLAQADKDRYESRLEHASEWVSDVEDALWEQRLHPKWLYLMLSESGGKLDAVSKHGAVGPWQLTSLIARKYGCSDRKDPVQSTIAAASYIKKLLIDFNGDEKKVIMAYNMGGSNLRKYGPTREAKNLSELVICLFKTDPLFLTQKEFDK